MSALSVRVLGALDVTVDGLPTVVKANQQRIVLECLALRANTVVASDLLIELLWGDHPPAKPFPQLQVYITNLRRLLDPGRSKGSGTDRLASRPGGFVLALSVSELDLLQFTEQITLGEQAVASGNLEEGSEHLQTAISLFRGRAFPDLVDIEELRPELNKLEERRLEAQQNFFDIELALGRHAGIIAELQALIVQDPYHERLWESYVLGLYRSGRQADALAACREARQIFLDDLGVDPGPGLRSLEVLVLKQDPTIAAPALNGRRRTRQRVDNLPAPLTPLIGRARELAALTRLFDSSSHRLVTITGPGGTGKTRIALEAARILGANMIDGVCWVDLAPLTDPSQVPVAVAAALGIEELAGLDPLVAAARFLRQRRLLMVLDNFEHLEDAWETPQELLTVAPDVRLLVTSRRPLGLRAEFEFELESLALPQTDPPLPLDVLRQVPAVLFFLARGRAARRQFEVDEANAGVVTRLCHRLDGLPLAIELAAAQLRNSNETELLVGLESNVVDLPPAFRDLPERQRTLAETIEWSRRLLGEHEGRLFDHLGVFAGDPTVEAVSGVLGPEIGEDQLQRLARHSLLRLRKLPHRPARVSMLQSIREFARDRLLQSGSQTSVKRTHAMYYLGVAERLAPLLWGEAQVNAFRELQEDSLEFRAALLWAAGPDGSADVALRFIGHLSHFWELTGDAAEPYRVANDVLSRDDGAADELTGPALSGTATLCWVLGNNIEASDYHRRSLEAFRRAGNGEGVAWAKMCLAVQASETGATETAYDLAADVLSAPDAAERTYFGALTVHERLAFYGGDNDRALVLSQQSVDLASELGDRWLRIIALVNQADSLERAGDPSAAERALYEAIEVGLELGAQGNVAGCLESLAGIYVKQGRFDPAIRILAAADAYRGDRGHLLYSSERQRIDLITSQAQADAGPIRFGLDWTEGQSLTLAQAVQQVVIPAMEFGVGASGVPPATGSPKTRP